MRAYREPSDPDSSEPSPWVWSWDDWSRALTNRFFPPAHASSLQLFNVDELALAGITGLKPAEAVELLCGVVSRELGASHDCSRVVAMLRDWESGPREAAPPVLPLLAVAVLAATNMGSDEFVDSRDYYRPYRRLLGLAEENGGEPPGYGAHIPWMWRVLSDWVDKDPERGRTSIESGPRPFIGFALGQAAFRQSDLIFLHRFFRSYGFDAAEEEDPALVRAYLAEWSGTETSGSGKRLRRLATQEELAEQCQTILTSELARWDPDKPDGTGGSIHSGAIRLALSLQPLGARMVAVSSGGLDEHAEWQLGSGRSISLHHVGEGWFDLSGLGRSDIVEGLVKGLDIVGGGRQLSFRPAKVHALRWDDILGEWVSTDHVAVGIVHHLLVAPDVNAELQAFTSGEGLAASLDPTATPYFDSRWFLIRDFRMDTAPKGRIPEVLAPLLRGGGLPRLRLSGGLRMGQHKRSYVIGGAPSLGLPPKGDRVFQLFFEGFDHPEEFRVPPDNSEFPLDALRLEPGRYEVVQGKRRLSFSISAGLPHDGGEGMGTVQLRGSGGFASGVIAHCDVVAGPAPRPVRLLRAPVGEGAFLGSQADEYEPVIRAEWLRATGGGPWWTVVDAPRGFDPVWLLDQRRDSFVLRQIGQGEPQAVARPVPRWARAFREGQLWTGADASEAALFGRFREVANPVPLRRQNPVALERTGMSASQSDFEMREGMDALLRWCSERGSGSWDSLRSATAAIQRTWASPRKGWWIATQLAALGHIDVDWGEGRWSAAPPAISLLPGTGGCAVLTGSRTRHLLERLLSDLPNGVDSFEVHMADGPTAIYLKVSSIQDLEVFAASVGILLVADPAASLASLLPVSDDCLELANPPHGNAELERLDVASSRWRPTQNESVDGLYRWEHQGLASYRLFQDGSWWRATDAGHLSVVANRATPKPCLRWKPRTPSGQKPDRLLVYGRIALPHLAVRALVSSSGQIPQWSGSGSRRLTYLNVDRDLALHVGGKMGLHVEIAQ